MQLELNRRRLFALCVFAPGVVWTLTGCGLGLRPAVSMRLRPHPKTPRDASVWIDEEFVGLLGYVAARGVRLPEGEHRITIERDGYFPWDEIVVSDREPINLEVRLIPIPD